MGDDTEDQGGSPVPDPAWTPPSEPSAPPEADATGPTMPIPPSPPGFGPPAPRPPGATMPVPPPPPGFVPPPFGDAPTLPRRDRTGLLVALAVLVVVAVGAGAVVLLAGEESRDPDDALAAAQSFAGDASSFRFTYTAEDTYVLGDAGAPGPRRQTATAATASGPASSGTR